MPLPHLLLFILSYVTSILDAEQIQSGVHSQTFPDQTVYRDISWLCAHNAMSNKEDNWTLPNQNWSIDTQLKKGIHAQMWDVWKDKDQLLLRHGNGSVFLPGSIHLKEAFTYIKDYLSKNDTAIITLIFESYVEDQDIWDVLCELKMDQLILPQKNLTKNTRLSELRNKDHRLIIFIDKPTKYFIPVWDVAVETDWENKRAQSMKNTIRRGKKENFLFILNHFISNPLFSEASSQYLNQSTQLLPRIKEIQTLYNRSINFIALDFIGTDDEIELIKKINSHLVDTP